MKENNFLPYEMRKKNEVLKNKLVNSTIIILFIINVVFLINLYFNILSHREKDSIKQGADISLQTKNNKTNFRDADILKLISKKIKGNNYTHISIKDGIVEFEFSSQEDLQRSIKDIENDSNLIIKSLVKSQSSNNYNMVVEVKNI